MLELTRGNVYRVAYNADNPRLRGRIVAFLGFSQYQGDILRARVQLIGDDSKDIWLVNRGVLISV